MANEEPGNGGPVETYSVFRLQLVREEPGVGAPKKLLLPAEAAEYVGHLLLAEPAEVMGAIFLDVRHNAIGHCIAYRGTLARCTVEPRGVLVPALLANAAGLLLFHNHPTGDSSPSIEDRIFTKRIKDAGELLGIPVHDHLIFGEGGGWVSALSSGRVWPPRAAVATGARCASAVVEALREERDGRKRVAPKYRDPENPAQTWAGRGCPPAWLRRRLADGTRLEDFLIPGAVKRRPGK